MKVLVTGVAGFIGFHVAQAFAQRGAEVLGIDNMDPAYDLGLKRARLSILSEVGGCRIQLLDIATDPGGLIDVMHTEAPDTVIHLAARAGVRDSIEHPSPFVQSNIVGFFNVLEACRASTSPHLIYASSSSVYGANTSVPFSVDHSVEHPRSLYAATKKSNELMAHSYSHLYNLPTTALRFFTVYGPWDRPNMALSIFSKAILSGEPIDVFNHGKMARDYTYISDVVESIYRLAREPARPDPTWSSDDPSSATGNCPYRVLNIGCGEPIRLLTVIEHLEEHLGKKANLKFLPMQRADVQNTHSETDDLARAIQYRPQVRFGEGIARFVEWYRSYYATQT